MAQSIYAGPKLNGFYWYAEGEKMQVVEYRSGQVAFCGMAGSRPLASCAGEFFGPIPLPV